MKIVNNDEELKDMVFARMKREMDQITRLDNARKQGYAEGYAEEVTRGRKRVLEVYRCLKQGMDIEEIAQTLNMTLAEVAEVKNELLM